MTKSITTSASLPPPVPSEYASAPPAPISALDNPLDAGFKPLGTRTNGRWKIFAFHLANFATGGGLFRKSGLWADQLAGSQKLSSWKQDFAESYLNTVVGFDGRDAFRYPQAGSIDQRPAGQRLLHRLAVWYSGNPHGGRHLPQGGDTEMASVTTLDRYRETPQERQRRAVKDAEAIRAWRPDNNDDPRLTVAELEGASRLLQNAFADAAEESGHSDHLEFRQLARELTAVTPGAPADPGQLDDDDATYRMSSADLHGIYHEHFAPDAKIPLQLGGDIEAEWRDLFDRHLAPYEQEMTAFQQDRATWQERRDNAVKDSPGWHAANVQLRMLKMQMQSLEQSAQIGPKASKEFGRLVKKTDEACRQQLEPVAAKLGKGLVNTDASGGSTAPDIDDD